MRPLYSTVVTEHLKVGHSIGDLLLSRVSKRTGKHIQLDLLGIAQPSATAELGPVYSSPSVEPHLPKVENQYTRAILHK